MVLNRLINFCSIQYHSVTLYLFVFIHIHTLATDYSIHLIRKGTLPWLPLANKGGKLACDFLHKFILMTVSLQHCSHQFVNLPFKLSVREIYKYTGRAHKKRPWDHCAPWGEIPPYSLGLPKKPEVLALPNVLGPWWKRVILGVANGLKIRFCLHPMCTLLPSSPTFTILRLILMLMFIIELLYFAPFTCKTPRVAS